MLLIQHSSRFILGISIILISILSIQEIKVESSINLSDKFIIFLTARSEEYSEIAGFEAGADDYITKPFSMEELMARMNAILRRVDAKHLKNRQQKEFSIGKFSFYAEKRLLKSEGEEDQKLTSKESELLRLLCLNKNKVMDRTVALKTIWNDDSYFNSRSMDVYITKLRKYLKSLRK